MTSGKKKTGRFRAQLQKTVAEEKKSLDDRFAKADVALGNAEDPTPDPSPPAPEKKRVIRDAFSIPEDDYELIDKIRGRLVRELAMVRNKSEVVRAGLKLLYALDADQLREAAEAVEQLKPGRPPG